MYVCVQSWLRYDVCVSKAGMIFFLFFFIIILYFVFIFFDVCLHVFIFIFIFVLFLVRFFNVCMHVGMCLLVCVLGEGVDLNIIDWFTFMRQYPCLLWVCECRCR